MSGQLSMAGVLCRDSVTPTAALSQWFTRAPLAERIVRWAGVHPGMRVLEPSAGNGSLVKPLRVSGAEVFAVEIDPAMASSLIVNHEGVIVHIGDFLSMSPKSWPDFDMVCMNPPYECGADLEHVSHALEFAPRVVALVRLAFLAGQKRRRGLWARHTLTRLAILSERPDFEGERDDSPKSDFCVVEIVRGPAPEGHTVEVEWW